MGDRVNGRVRSIDHHLQCERDSMGESMGESMGSTLLRPQMMRSASYSRCRSKGCCWRPQRMARKRQQSQKSAFRVGAIALQNQRRCGYPRQKN